MKILAFAGSTSSTSINRELVKFVLKDFQDEEINLMTSTILPCLFFQ
jgi:NAD(P)H-dependent FMN reductase